MEQSKVLDTIKKLLRLAQSDNIHEATLAAAKAQELMITHGIEQAQAQLDGTQSEPDEEIENYGQRPEGHLAAEGGIMFTWASRLAVVVAQNTGCAVFRSRRQVNGKTAQTLEVIGRPSDVEATRYMYAWLRGEIDRLAEKEGKGMGFSWRNNFRGGAVTGLHQRLKAQRQEQFDRIRSQAKHSVALVRVEQSIQIVEKRRMDAELFMKQKLRHGYSNRKVGGTFNGSAHEAGRNAARSIQLNNRGALGKGASKQLKG